MQAVLDQPRVKRLLSTDHFSVDGTLIEAWASMKSFKPRDGSDEPPPSDSGRNAEANFRGRKRSNETHGSTTDPEAKLYRKGSGKEAKLCFITSGSPTDVELNVGRTATNKAYPFGSGDDLLTNVDSLTLRAASIDIQFCDGAGDLTGSLSMPWAHQTFRRKREVIGPSAPAGDGARPIRAEARTKLLAAVAKARRWLGELTSGAVADVEAIADREAVGKRSVRMGLSPAFLAPDIVQAAVDGTLPRGPGVSRQMDLPADWTDQRRTIGIARTP